MGIVPHAIENFPTLYVYIRPDASQLPEIIASHLTGQANHGFGPIVFCFHIIHGSTAYFIAISAITVQPIESNNQPEFHFV